MTGVDSDELAEVRAAAARLQGHERAGSEQALRRAEADLDSAIRAAADSGHDAEAIASAGGSELVANRVRQMLSEGR